MLCLSRSLHPEVHKVLACHKFCTSRSTKYSEICTSRSTEYCTRHEICTSRFTKCCACQDFENEPHVEKSRFTALVTKLQRVQDHHIQSAAPATTSAFRSEAAPIPCICHEKSTLDTPKHEVSLAPATKSDHHVRKWAPLSWKNHSTSA